MSKLKLKYHRLRYKYILWQRERQLDDMKIDLYDAKYWYHSSKAMKLAQLKENK